MLTITILATLLLAYACYDVVTKLYPRLWWLRVTGLLGDAGIAAVIIITVLVFWRH